MLWLAVEHADFDRDMLMLPRSAPSGAGGVGTWR